MRFVKCFLLKREGLKKTLRRNSYPVNLTMFTGLYWGERKISGEGFTRGGLNLPSARFSSANAFPVNADISQS